MLDWWNWWISTSCVFHGVWILLWTVLNSIGFTITIGFSVIEDHHLRKKTIEANGSKWLKSFSCPCFTMIWFWSCHSLGCRLQPPVSRVVLVNCAQSRESHGAIDAATATRASGYGHLGFTSSFMSQCFFPTLNSYSWNSSTQKKKCHCIKKKTCES